MYNISIWATIIRVSETKCIGASVVLDTSKLCLILITRPKSVFGRITVSDHPFIDEDSIGGVNISQETTISIGGSLAGIVSEDDILVQYFIPHRLCRFRTKTFDRSRRMYRFWCVYSDESDSIIVAS